jgi:hypothetical protein
MEYQISRHTENSLDNVKFLYWKGFPVLKGCMFPMLLLPEFSIELASAQQEHLSASYDYSLVLPLYCFRMKSEIANRPS